MSRVFVRNLGTVLISETKPGIGTFNIPGEGRVEIFDDKRKQALPGGTEVEYVYTTARQIADSIVRDRGRGDLEVEVEETAEEKKASKDREDAAAATAELNRKADSDARVAKAENEVAKAKAAAVEADAKLNQVKEEEAAREKEYQDSKKKAADALKPAVPVKAADKPAASTTGANA